MAFFGLLGNDRAMATSTYAGRESASARRDRKQAQHDADIRRHRKAATRIDRQVAATENDNRRQDSAPQRGRRWW